MNKLKNYIDKSPLKAYFNNLTSGDNTSIKSLLNNNYCSTNENNDCIHNIGDKLMCIYITWYTRLLKYFPNLKVSKYYLPTKNPDIYLTAGVDFDSYDPTKLSGLSIKLIQADSTNTYNLSTLKITYLKTDPYINIVLIPSTNVNSYIDVNKYINEIKHQIVQIYSKLITELHEN